MIAIYIAHQYGGDPANRAAAAKWCAFFASLGYAPIADWIVLTGEWSEERRLDGLAIDCELIERSDVVVQVGPTISDGMNVESGHADHIGVPVVDFVGLFPATPDALTQAQTIEMMRAINSAVV
jgi:hypothetical protein